MCDNTNRLETVTKHSVCRNSQYVYMHCETLIIQRLRQMFSVYTLMWLKLPQGEVSLLLRLLSPLLRLSHLCLYLLYGQTDVYANT